MQFISIYESEKFKIKLYTSKIQWWNKYRNNISNPKGIIKEGERLTGSNQGHNSSGKTLILKTLSLASSVDEQRRFPRILGYSSLMTLLRLKHLAWWCWKWVPVDFQWCCYMLMVVYFLPSIDIVLVETLLWWVHIPGKSLDFLLMSQWKPPLPYSSCVFPGRRINTK